MPRAMTLAETIDATRFIFSSAVALAETAPEAESDASCVNCDYRLRAADLVCDRCAYYIAKLKVIYREGGKQRYDRTEALMREAEGERVPLLKWAARIAAARQPAPRRRKGAAA